MVAKIKLAKVGNSVGAILPKDALAVLRADVGDTLYLTEAPGGFRLTPYEPDFEAQMDAARKIMRKHRGVLRQLAK